MKGTTKSSPSTRNMVKGKPAPRSTTSINTPVPSTTVIPTTETTTKFSMSALRPVLIYAAVIAAFLLVVGFGSDTLPFPRGGTFSDAAISHWPAAMYLQETIRAGQFPLWRDLLMGGQPFAVNPLNKVLYPPQWLAVILPAALHLNLMIWLHLLLAAVSMRALALRLRLSPTTAGIVGLAYALTPRLIAAGGAGHLDLLYAASWIPALLWAVHKLVTESLTRRNIALIGLIAAMGTLADIRLTVFALAFAVAFGMWLALVNPATKQSAARLQSLLFAAVISVLLFAALTAVQWMPLSQLSSFLSRNGLTQAESGVFALEPSRLITLIVPDPFGGHDTMIYSGVSIFLLALVAVMRAPRRHLFWIGVIVFAAWYAMGMNGGLWTLLTTIAPPLLWLRVPPRIWYIGALSLIVLAGYGIDALTDPAIRRNTLVMLGWLFIGVALLVGAAMASVKLTIAALIVIGMGGVGFLLLNARSVSPELRMIFVMAVIFADLGIMDGTLIEGRSRANWLDQYQPIAAALQEAGVTRVYSPDYGFPQQAAAYWHIPTFGGVDPFQLRAFVGSFEAATGTHSTGYTVTLPPFEGIDLKTSNQSAVIDAGKLALWNVSHVLASFPIDNADLKLVSRPADLYLYENTRRPVGYSVTWDGPNRFTAVNKSESPVNVSVWVPSWINMGNTTFGMLNTAISSTVESEPNSATAIRVEAGKSLSAAYDAPGLSSGAALSLGALFIALSLLLNRTR